MVHPDYPSRALLREWRVSYKRRARHKAVAFAVCLAIWVALIWMVSAAVSSPASLGVIYR